jgi:hypothetical protein
MVVEGQKQFIDEAKKFRWSYEYEERSRFIRERAGV